MKLFRDMPA